MSDIAQPPEEVEKYHAPAIPFDTVAARMDRRRYLKLVSADYANSAAELFDAHLFASDLGVSKEELVELEVIERREQSGWNLTAQPEKATVSEKWKQITECRVSGLERWAKLHGKTIVIERRPKDGGDSS